MEQDGQDAGVALTGRRARADTRHPTYRGIRFRGGKWVSEIRKPGKASRIWLGTYRTPEMAAAAFDVAALALRGSEAALNFPGAATSWPAPISRTSEDIRAAAAAAAAAMANGTGSRRLTDAGASCSESCSASCRAGDRERVMVVDEDDVFEMPRLLVSMAEGLMMSPPRLSAAPTEEAEEDDHGMSLWGHS